ncbi:DUF3231 family protein [Ammoniphilus sp. 3BR4]|uniref:DUF3231 family protein n=1 Tax=Ammoniphilus sp. 3BR4 TaxID=3158265 RepID=UPI003466A7F2
MVGGHGLSFHAAREAFRLRSDLTLTMARLTPKIYNFAKRGGEIMIKHGWMEEPPPVEDRKALIKV